MLSDKSIKMEMLDFWRFCGESFLRVFFLLLFETEIRPLKPPSLSKQCRIVCGWAFINNAHTL